MKKNAPIFIILLVILSALIFIKKPYKQEQKDGVNDNQLSNLEEKKEATPMPTNNQNQLPSMQIDATKTYTAVLKTSSGEITVDLNAKQTPVTVNNFVSLAKKDFYTNTIFHRVMEDFMIQGGDPKGDGTGGPGYTFTDELFEGDYTRGTIAMANAGPNTNGSQFFIMHADYALPKNYVIFGKVVKGLEVVDKIAQAPVELNSMGERSKPINPVSINSIEIIER